MKQPTLRSIEHTGNKLNNGQATIVPPTGPAVVKTLDSAFESIGDALYSWCNSDGYERPEEKRLDTNMVRAFCSALRLPVVGLHTNKLLSNSQYFESDVWLFDYFTKHNYQRAGLGQFYLLDHYNRPIAFVDVETSVERNIAVGFTGAEYLAMEFIEELKKHVKLDEKVEKKTTYVEVVPERGGFMQGGGGLTLTTGKIDNPRISHPLYYPFLDGGAEALIKDFIESEESVLILMGPPGTGKSSLIAATTDSLGLLPIYAKKAEVILHKDFVSYVFGASDTYMAKVAGTSARARSDMFKERTLKDREFSCGQPLDKSEEDDDPSVPVIVVEDADNILAPRSTGNLIMPELLNETDGIGSNHTRKIIFTTNLSNISDIDEALMRPGRCYGVIHCRSLTPAEAVAAREANGLPPFDTMPVKDVTLAEALRKPRKRICISNGKAGIGFKD